MTANEAELFLQLIFNEMLQRIILHFRSHLSTVYCYKRVMKTNKHKMNSPIVSRNVKTTAEEIFSVSQSRQWQKQKTEYILSIAISVEKAFVDYTVAQ